MIDYDQIPGLISKQALAEHIKLYNGYVEMLGRVDQKQNIQVINKNDLKLDSAFANNMWAQSYSIGGIDLHELYFEGLSITPSTPSDSLLSFIGDFDDFINRIIEVGMVSRGWVVVAQNPKTMTWRIFSMDSHDEGAVFGYIPFLVIDTWEHAYWMDWGTNKEGYLKTLVKHINWLVIEDRML